MLFKIKQLLTEIGMNESLIIDSLYFRGKGHYNIKVNEMYYKDFYGAHILKH